MMIEVYQSNVKNEDVIVAGEKTFGVIDGATPLGGSHSVLMRFLKRFTYHILENEEQPLMDSIEHALFMESSFDREWMSDLPSAAAGIIRIRDDAVEIAKTGDVVILIRGKTTQILDKSKLNAIDEESWRTIINYMKSGLTYEEAMEKARETVLKENRMKLGSDYNVLYPGCSIEVFETHIYSINDVDTVIIMSDGAYRAVEAGLYSVENLFDTSGEDVLKKLRAWEKHVDPLEVKFPFFSRHDDATIVKIEIKK